MTPAAALQHWLDVRLNASASHWLHASVVEIEAEAQASDRALFRCVSLASRKLGKAPLALDAQALTVADRARPGWDPSNWTVDQAGRVRLLLAAAHEGLSFQRRLDALCTTADIDELLALYRGLPLYPDQPQHRARAAEGLRSNMKVVFEAVAHRNPYPAEQLPEDAWNQMVLKALFVGSALDPIVGLDRRANAALARMLGDYAHERWAARRPVNPELWRCIGPFATGRLLTDLARVLDEGSAPERAAAVLALRTAADPEAARLLDRHGALRDAVARHGIDWTTVPEFA